MSASSVRHTAAPESSTNAGGDVTRWVTSHTSSVHFRPLDFVYAVLPARVRNNVKGTRGHNNNNNANKPVRSKLSHTNNNNANNTNQRSGGRNPNKRKNKCSSLAATTASNNPDPITVVPISQQLPVACAPAPQQPPHSPNVQEALVNSTHLPVIPTSARRQALTAAPASTLQRKLSFPKKNKLV